MDDMHETNSSDEILKRIREEIIPLFEKAILDDSVFFENPHLVHCRGLMHCTKDDCPVSSETVQRCWQVAGTYCGGKVQGDFADKYENCKICDVFQVACPTIVEELGEHLNNMLFLLRRKSEELRERGNKIEHLNRALLSSLENLEAKNREIQEMVITDKLTGLNNRNYLLTVLEDEILRCERKGYQFSLLMLDIDDFKKVNDLYGHIGGDQILSGMGLLMKNIIRKYDRAFRYGGEEFIVVLPETDLTIAWMVAGRIRDHFAGKRFSVKRAEDGRPEDISCTVSIGCASYQADLTVTQLLKQADDAMYAAKSRGKNAVVRFDEI